MNDSLDDVLHRYFDDVARHDDLGDTPVRVVMRRGRRRRARRRTGAMAGTLVVGALGSMVAVRTLSTSDGKHTVKVGNGDPNNSNGETPSPVPTAGDATLAPSPLVWNDVTVGSAEAVAVGGPGVMGDASGGFFALSTEPGRTVNGDAQRAVYRSADGIAWEPSGDAPPSGDRWAWDITAAGGRIYAVSTQAATAPVADTFDPGELALAASADGGATWNQRALPIDLASIRTMPGVKAVHTSASIAAGPSTTLVAAVTNATLDIEALAPAGVEPVDFDWWGPDGAVQYAQVPVDCDQMTPLTAPTEGATDSTAPAETVSTTPEATAVESATTVQDGGAGPGQCFIRGDALARYSWAELGVAPETLRARNGALHFSASTDSGATFTALPAPTLPDGLTASSVQAVPMGSGFAVFVRLDDFSDPNHAISRTVAYLSPNGIDWEASDVPITSVSDAGVLADGTLVAVGYDGVRTTVATYRDGAWLQATLPTADAAGNAFLADGYLVPAVGPLGVAIVAAIDDDGEPAVAVNTTTQAPVAPVATVVGPGERRPVLLFSPDGITWSIEDLSDIAGRSVGAYDITSLSVTAERVAFAVAEWPAGTGSDVALADQHVFLGTLAG